MKGHNGQGKVICKHRVFFPVQLHPYNDSSYKKRQKMERNDLMTGRWPRKNIPMHGGGEVEFTTTKLPKEKKKCKEKILPNTTILRYKPPGGAWRSGRRWKSAVLLYTLLPHQFKLTPPLGNCGQMSQTSTPRNKKKKSTCRVKKITKRESVVPQSRAALVTCEKSTATSTICLLEGLSHVHN